MTVLNTTAGFKVTGICPLTEMCFHSFAFILLYSPCSFRHVSCLNDDCRLPDDGVSSTEDVSFTKDEHALFEERYATAHGCI